MVAFKKNETLLNSELLVTLLWLQELQAHVPDGQRRFEDLLRFHPVIGNSEDLEDLRYRWMLYKSKLKESMSSPVGDSTQFAVADLCQCSFRLLQTASLNSAIRLYVLN